MCGVCGWVWVASLFCSYYGSTLSGDCLCVSVAWVVSPVATAVEPLVLDMHFLLLPLAAMSRHLPFTPIFSASTTLGSPLLGDFYAIVAFKFSRIPLWSSLCCNRLLPSI
ncbi:hypothetical protein Prudu_000094 [Prunus dulcis]|uniref:Uncharacterized protein n=1 Tax=Prunus dulcis TaxID=3755 RepID=A0A4Y1QKF7_PRUDU|nr:hypothetical protein Prudu_000094 [Prunus dulcis]